MRLKDAHIEKLYDNVPYYLKDSAGMPFHFGNLTLDQQLFFRVFTSGLEFDTAAEEDLMRDLDLLKADLEAIIDSVNNK